MIRPLAFCAGVALAWCGTAEAADFNDDVIRYLCSNVPSTNVSCREALKQISQPEDAVRVEIDDLKERVDSLEVLLHALLQYLPECSGEPPKQLPCLEKREAE